MKTKTDVQAINAALEGAKDLLGFELKRASAGYTLHLTLGRKEGMTVTLLCSDVQNLELNPTGDGFEQMYDLQVIDMREDGLDRIHFSVEEVERESLFLHCADVQLLN